MLQQTLGIAPDTNTPEKFELSTAAVEINAAHKQAIQYADKAIEFARKAGELLLKAKSDLPHGEFLPWVEKNCAVTQRQAQRYMAAAQGKPTPMRVIKNATATKYDTVSHLKVNEGEAIYIDRVVGGWENTMTIFPKSDAPGFFHYGFMSGEVGSGARCTYSKRAIAGKHIELMAGFEFSNLLNSEIVRFAHPGYVENPFNADGIERFNPTLHKNIGLARDLVEQFVADSPMITGNEQLFKLLDGGGEYEISPLPGDTLNAIVGNLKTLHTLASEPVTRGKENEKLRAKRQREKVMMLALNMTALLSTGN